VPTTQISLIREHTEKIKPPRALWVTFELGRPFGAPNDPAFQTRVLKGALELFDADSGPVLVDHPEDVPTVEAPASLVNPASISMSDTDEGDTAKLAAKLLEEIALIRPWYDRSVEDRKRTTVGVSGMEPEAMGSFIAEFLDGSIPESKEDINPVSQFKLAIDDLKAYYFEAATAQPGQEGASSDSISSWFYRETVAGTVLHAVRNAQMDTENRTMRLITRILLIPGAYSQPSPPQATR
jgi:hypothetical protein